MIQVSDVIKSYFLCNACLGDIKIKNISLIVDSRIQSTFRLCKECRKELVKLFMDESEVKS